MVMFLNCYLNGEMELQQSPRFCHECGPVSVKFDCFFCKMVIIERASNYELISGGLVEL